VTLRDAAEATGIPVNTLRKWCRHDSVDSYLESDGEVTLRIVDLMSVRQRAETLGRTLTAEPTPPTQEEPPPQALEPAPATDAPQTMIVPVDAWNKMLTQLGNLHEAGQQLAEARERAAKAETEAKFLRERLAEIRAAGDEPPAASNEPPAASNEPPAASNEQERSDADAGEPSDGETTSFIRYVVRGWRGRKR